MHLSARKQKFQSFQFENDTFQGARAQERINSKFCIATQLFSSYPAFSLLGNEEVIKRLYENIIVYVGLCSLDRKFILKFCS